MNGYELADEIKITKAPLIADIIQIYELFFRICESKIGASE